MRILRNNNEIIRYNLNDFLFLPLGVSLPKVHNQNLKTGFDSKPTVAKYFAFPLIPTKEVPQSGCGLNIVFTGNLELQ